MKMRSFSKGFWQTGSFNRHPTQIKRTRGLLGSNSSLKLCYVFILLLPHGFDLELELSHRPFTNSAVNTSAWLTYQTGNFATLVSFDRLPFNWNFSIGLCKVNLVRDCKEVFKELAAIAVFDKMFWRPLLIHNPTFPLTTPCFSALSPVSQFVWSVWSQTFFVSEYHGNSYTLNFLCGSRLILTRIKKQ